MTPRSPGKVGTELKLNVSCEQFLERLQASVRRAGRLSLLTGDGLTQGFLLEVPTSHAFRLRKAGPGPALYVLHLRGRFIESQAGCSVSVTYGRHPLGVAVIWLQRAFIAVLTAGAVIAGLRQPVFLAFALFVLVGGFALLWTERARGDRTELFRFLNQMSGA